VSTSRIGRTQKEDGERRIDQQHILHRMAFRLAARTAPLPRRILGTLDAPFGAIVAKRGEADGSPGGDGSWGSATTAVAPSSATPRRFASSVTDRAGASRSVRSVDRKYHQEDMNPLVGLALAHAEQPSLDDLEGIGLQIDQEKRQAILRRQQRTVLVSRIPPGGGRLPRELEE
jgi:hypothetical protein